MTPRRIWNRIWLPSGVNLATKELDVEPEEFAENAYGDEDPTDSDKENSTAGDMAYEIEKPDGYRTHIYEEATPILNLLMESPTDEGLKAKLGEFNELIKAQNKKEGKPLHDFLIKIDTYSNNFRLAKPRYTALTKDPINKKARYELEKINNALDGLNQRHGYPATWTIGIPADLNAGSSEAAKGGFSTYSY